MIDPHMTRLRSYETVREAARRERLSRLVANLSVCVGVVAVVAMMIAVAMGGGR